MKGFYFITDKNLTKNGIIKDCELAVEGGVSIIQYREKNASTREMVETAKRIKELEVTLIINDRIDIALAVDADGVHLGQDDMDLKTARRMLPGKIIGITVHDVREAMDAENNRADYIGVSPVFQTSTKADAGNAIGIETLKKIREAVKIPIAAIGGVTLENVDSVIGAGADMVCAISATVGRDVKKEARSFQEKFR
ncbi:thiamine phosphate synthase [Candidatus Woesearchaeota archaeon]|nr:thiamine phosphate synthase [Candidatus Woesearchaeota archaeon]